MNASTAGAAASALVAVHSGKEPLEDPAPGDDGDADLVARLAYDLHAPR